MSIRIALAGNPNCGKTTMFNYLTGSSQYVGNWPGVTVEKKEGHLRGHKDVIITDLPGIYSLSPYTLEEVVSRNYLMDEGPDAIINLVDATNLERNLYLSTQVIELGIPVLVVLNMIDLVEKNGTVIKAQKLAEELGCEIALSSALKGTGVMEAAEKAIALARAKKPTGAPAQVWAGSGRGAGHHCRYDMGCCAAGKHSLVQHQNIRTGRRDRGKAATQQASGRKNRRDHLGYRNQDGR